MPTSLVWVGLIGSGVLFGLVHFSNTDFWAIGAIAFSGVGFAALYLRTGSIIPAVVAHAFNNGVAFFGEVGVGWWLQLLAGFGAVAVVLAVLLPIARRRSTPQPFRRKKPRLVTT